MQVLDQSSIILSPSNAVEWEKELLKIEKAARNCYQSEPKGNQHAFIKRLVDKGHHAMLEFGAMTVQFITDRGVTHEIVRHRLFSFAQESTRYCKYEDEICVIRPSTFSSWDQISRDDWEQTCLYVENCYIAMLKQGLSPQQARSVLPNSLKTSIIVHGNFREWRHFFSLRDHDAAHPDMRALVKPLHEQVKNILPCIFED